MLGADGRIAVLVDVMVGDGYAIRTNECGYLINVLSKIELMVK